jgi:transposase
MSKPLPESDTFRRIEVLTGTGRRRRWPDEVKEAIIAETLEDGAVVSEVARRHGVAPNQVFTWRKEARQRALALTTETAHLRPLSWSISGHEAHHRLKPCRLRSSRLRSTAPSCVFR